jgi:uncharacterized protein YndB with AHSA1/START domain
MYDLKGTIEEQGEKFGIAVEQRVDTPVERAYAAWADGSMISSWFTEHQEQDLRVGGRYSNSDGDSGEFLEVEPERRIAFTWEQSQHTPGSWVAVDFIPDGDASTRVRLTHNNLHTRDEAMNLDEGWSWAVDSMKNYLEQGTAIRYNEWLARRAVSAS